MLLWLALSGALHFFGGKILSFYLSVYPLFQAPVLKGRYKALPYQQFPLPAFHQITLPMLKPITYLVVTLGIIWSFQVFDLAYLMTGGGPGRATVTLVMGIYNAAFKQYKMGYASAMAMLLLLIVVIINVIENLFFKERKGK